MHCNGKCVMMKKLKEAEQQEQQAPERKFQNQSEFYSQPSAISLIDADVTVIVNYNFTLLRTAVAEGFNRAVFHPPAYTA